MARQHLGKDVWAMDIGKPLRIYTIEPVEDPVPAREPAPRPEPQPVPRRPREKPEPARTP